jgi:hypothetical protein
MSGNRLLNTDEHMEELENVFEDFFSRDRTPS